MKFNIVETIYSEKVKTVRLGTTGAGNQYGHEEVGKAVKLSGESAYVLCAAGDPIEGIVSSSNLAEQGTVDGFSIGGIISWVPQIFGSHCFGCSVVGPTAIACMNPSMMSATMTSSVSTS